ncbi:MAG: PCP reductase family protein [Crocinitomicaceae bacterium]|nr:PCP reductase family protein [Crocinitomicaceae bacterium]MDG2440616.1 PCP reductase family protein [Crocinitomicaceae bacterium]
MEGTVKWDPDAYKKLVKVPWIFLKMGISKINEAAETEGVDLVTPEFLDKVNDKRKWLSL